MKTSVACHITFYTFRWRNDVHWYINAFHLLRHIPTLITNSFGTNKWMIMISLAMKRMHNFQSIPKVLSPNKSNGNKWRLSMFIHIYACACNYIQCCKCKHVNRISNNLSRVFTQYSDTDMPKTNVRVTYYINAYIYI